MAEKIYIIGIGYKPLDKRAREIIMNSSIILVSSRLYDVFKEYDEFGAVKERIEVINDVDETIEFIRARLEKCWSKNKNDFRSSDVKNFRAMVLLASGDPMFFGIGRRAVNEFGKEMVEIIPDLSSIQIAFSRIKEPWDDALLMSLHGGTEKKRRLPCEIEDIPFLLDRYNKIAILTDRENNPAKIASVLKPFSKLKVCVCERLGYEDERIIEGTPAELEELSYREPNIVLILRGEDSEAVPSILFGIREDHLSHSKGLITKDEVRAVAIHKLRLPREGILWDIGAGSGSISIESGRLSEGLRIFAVEKDDEQISHILRNKEKFHVRNLEIIKGEAPDVLRGLPFPDRVFIGGSGGRLTEIIGFIDKLGFSGIMVINATTMETLESALNRLRELNYYLDLTQIQISRLRPLGNKHHLLSQNPVFIITAEKLKSDL
ncbi:MAG: precorrin-6y C5,15-methyltransferase (decarboxylating) subunit CbiE [Thermodesulfovibrionales bacterium]|nr:precorrin-6y C5,15-methyltransferase (decarboxylating) subunit CbiE [Thermodesulfovibrionales bacterium]